MKAARVRVRTPKTTTDVGLRVLQVSKHLQCLTKGLEFSPVICASTERCLPPHTQPSLHRHGFLTVPSPLGASFPCPLSPGQMKVGVVAILANVSPNPGIATITQKRAGSG